MKNTTSAPYTKSAKRIDILDSTLRERTFGVSFSIGEKLSIASLLDGIGVSYIETAYSAGNPSEAEFLKQLPSVLKGTAQPVVCVSDSMQVSSLPTSIGSWVKNMSLRAGAWKSHLWDENSNREIEPGANLANLKKKLNTLNLELNKQTLLCVEHFFDGFFEDASYALSVLETAIDAGTKRLVLDDSRGASLPDQISKAVKLAASHFSSTENLTLGIHCHNDLGLAIANTIAAVQAG
ncbi:MAG TPA: hypothetical protein VED17_10775, partial [Nitrososphaerales archaeon]|nr:hypothetical protein [Nitrososphaerales archaeon]